MNIYNFVFSTRRSDRIKRHFVFWLLVFAYHIIRISFIYPPQLFWKQFGSIIFGALFWGTISNMVFSYTIVYYLIPRYFQRKKYFIFFGGILFMCLFLGATQFIHNLILNPQFSKALGYNKSVLPIIRAFSIRLLGNPPLICGLLLSLKTLKTWYLKQKENENLITENANAELQLLKAQIHPHFLFNTLNNIYSYTLNKSPEAYDLVSKLSDTLHYMITDCNTDLVALKKEFKMLEDYIGLEKVRYGERLELWIDISENDNSLLIAPLIMIPFVENCFKHGTSVMRGKQWIQLKITVHNNRMDFNLTNSKPPRPMENKNKNGIGLSNVQKRLALLYPGKHELSISSNESVFNVQLKMELHQLPGAEPVFKINTMDLTHHNQFHQS